MNFKSWKDAYEFLKEYCRCSCVNCKYTDDLDLNIGHSDLGYAMHFCSYYVSMVDLNLQTLCKHWISENDEPLSEYANEFLWKLSDDVINELESDPDKKWSIKEINEVIKR